MRVRLSLSDYLYTTVFISNSHGHGFAHNTKWSRVIGLSLLPELIPDGIFLILASTRGLAPCTRRMSPLPPYGMLVDERPGARSCAGECQVSSLGYEALWDEDRVFTTGRDARHIHRLIDGSEHLHPDCSPIKPRHVERSRTAGVQRRLHCPLSLRCANRYLAVGIPAPPRRHRQD
jgi:hypothetical protein